MMSWKQQVQSVYHRLSAAAAADGYWDEHLAAAVVHSDDAMWKPPRELPFGMVDLVWGSGAVVVAGGRRAARSANGHGGASAIESGDGRVCGSRGCVRDDRRRSGSDCSTAARLIWR